MGGPGMAEYRLRVTRFDPGRGAAPYEENWFSADIGELTVLEALDAMREATAGTLAFRRSCRSGICGACAMTIEGRAARARIAADGGLADLPDDPPEVCPKAVRFGPVFAALREMGAE